jgi:drug/metabolite transporter (DMT)-like permease
MRTNLQKDKFQMQQIHGIGLKIGAIALFTVMFALVKALSETIPAGQAVFFRSAFAIPVLFAWLMMQGELAGAVTVKSKRAHVWRGFVGTAAMGLNFTAAGFLPLPEITAIGFTTPLLIVVFASFLLGERVGVYRISAVLVGLIGVLIIVEPRLTFGEMEPTQDAMVLGVILATTAAACAALAQIQIRKMVQMERSSAIIFYFCITASVFSLSTVGTWVWPNLPQFLILILIGVLGGVGQIMLTTAYRCAPASVIAPFDYTAMIFALGIGYFAFAELPSAQMLLGAGIVIAAGVFVILREARLGLRRGQARRAKPPPAL